MKIKLHIERLILDGLPLERRHGRQVQAAVEAELVRLLAIDGLSPNLQGGGALPSVKAGPIKLADAGNGKALGKRIAKAVYGGIGR